MRDLLSDMMYEEFCSLLFIEYCYNIPSTLTQVFILVEALLHAGFLTTDADSGLST